ncbi:type II 3-dehydroquinate dehydratase [Melittangium boletus]|uniref:3-dehydroquinate dehydratase n=1 Tax=Melittangium boletus DSM 14713 TaxID=1294270 RepID=A0A250IJY5_9BACT|nr:type II 3-dehydroquinate dehydratase [Melittangium boletus]ATB31467.1 3-dehydroquinate dehydratase [Melittangium boletus DSM 14713]
MGKRLLVLHGPNLNLLGEREGREGGRLVDLDAALKARAGELGLELTVVQSNHEGVLLDTLHAERSRVEGVVVSPASLFGSYPLRDALEAIGLPALEVYLTELGERESVVADACVATLEGEGFDSYLEALARFASGDLTGEHSDEEDEESLEDEEEDEAPVGPVKTLGRKGKTPASETALAVAPARALAGPVGGSRKSLGRKVEAPAVAASPAKTLGRKAKEARAEPSEDFLSRALVRKKIADRLSGRLSPAELATWARAQWLEVQRGGPAESGQRELLEETLQRLTLSNVPPSRLSEPELVDLMTRMDR